MKRAVITICGVLAACSSSNVPASAQPADAESNVRAQIAAHAPYKQWDLVTGRPSLSIGRTPGAACETISYLIADGRDRGASSKATELANWVIERQKASTSLSISGGVASTPDLPAPGNAYHYSIDAAFCAAAMLDMSQATGRSEYTRSAAEFGGFLLNMMRDGAGRPIRAGDAGRAPCEAVVQTRSGAPAWNCQHHVKMLVSLPTLKRLDAAFPGKGYAQAARDIRSTLMPGLEGLWEYSDPEGSRQRWKRIQGPAGEPDTFVYGDTLAYALKGLHEYEGPSNDVRRLYARFSGMRGSNARTAAYDGHLAFAGYIRPNGQAGPEPDQDSAYYDIVTMGLLDAVRRDAAPQDAARTMKVLREQVATRPAIGWHVKFDMSAKTTGTGDISTLAAIGTALATDRQGARRMTTSSPPVAAPVIPGDVRQETIKISTSEGGMRSRAIPPQ